MTTMYEIEKYLKDAISGNIVEQWDDMVKLFDLLKKNGHTGKDNSFSWNDCDNSSFIYEFGDMKVICQEDQNMNYAYIFNVFKSQRQCFGEIPPTMALDLVELREQRRQGRYADHDNPARLHQLTQTGDDGLVIINMFNDIER